MLNEIFEEMKIMGWNLEDFDFVYNSHIDTLEELYKNCRYNEECEEFIEALAFVTDFLQAVNRVDFKNNTSKGVVDCD